MDNPAASNVFGIAGLIIWSTQMIPQIRWNYKRKSTEGVSLVCFTSWVLSGLVLAPYLVATDKGPALIVQISALTSLIVVVLFQHFYYDRKTPLKILIIAAVIVTALCVGISIGIYYVMDSFVAEKEFEVSLAVSIVSAFFMLAGFLPQIYEIYSTQNPDAISRIFICMDFSGASCAIISLAFIVPFDWMSFATYIIVPVCEFTQFWLITYYTRMVKTGKVEYEDETYEIPRKLSIWKRTHRKKTTSTAGFQMSKSGAKNTDNQDLTKSDQNLVTSGP